MDEYLLSTSDNPFNPWSDFRGWNAYDMQAGHHTLAYLARVAITSDEMSDADQDLAVKQAIDEIIFENINGLYIRVPKPDGYVPN